MKNLLNEVRGNIYGLGVYCFKDTEGKVLYVGSGMMNDRLSSHLHHLKRSNYEGTNKDALQKIYNYGDLTFEVLHFSANNSDYLNGTNKERQVIQKSLEVLEKFYYELYKDTVCNKIGTIHKFSTSPDEFTTYKRHRANRGNNNPNRSNDSNRDERILSEVLWLKCNSDMKVTDIAKHYDLSYQYVFKIGYNRWLDLIPRRPEWYAVNE